MSKKKILIVGAIALVVIISIVIIITVNGSKNENKSNKKKTNKKTVVLKCSKNLQMHSSYYGNGKTYNEQKFTFTNNKLSKFESSYVAILEKNQREFYNDILKNAYNDAISKSVKYNNKENQITIYVNLNYKDDEFVSKFEEKYGLNIIEANVADIKSVMKNDSYECR